MQTYIHAYHYCTYQYIPVHTITYHYIPLHTITYHYIPLHTITYHYIPLHTITYHYIPLHTITLHTITLHYIALHTITLHYTHILYVWIMYVCVYIYIMYIWGDGHQSINRDWLTSIFYGLTIWDGRPYNWTMAGIQRASTLIDMQTLLVVFCSIFRMFTRVSRFTLW